ncbi:hypothetical protein Ancab_014854 [Ancistrocladus abbreviatus]
MALIRSLNMSDLEAIGKFAASRNGVRTHAMLISGGMTRHPSDQGNSIWPKHGCDSIKGRDS